MWRPYTSVVLCLVTLKLKRENWCYVFLTTQYQIFWLSYTWTCIQYVCMPQVQSCYNGHVFYGACLGSSRYWCNLVPRPNIMQCALDSTIMHTHICIMLCLSPLMVFMCIHVHWQSLDSFFSHLPTLNRFCSLSADSDHLFHCSQRSQIHIVSPSPIDKSCSPSPAHHTSALLILHSNSVLFISSSSTLFSSTVNTSADRQ